MAIAGTMFQPQTGGIGTMPERYRQTAADFYGGYGIDPRTGGLTEEYRYDPMLIDTRKLQQAEAFDFNPMRQQALGGVGAAASSGLQSALSQQAAAGGLTAADRMALASSFNRQRIGGTADVLGRFGIAEAENIYETERANQEMMNKAYLSNLEEQRQAQAANIAMLMGQQEKMGATAEAMFREDARKRAGEAMAAGYDPANNPYGGGGDTASAAPKRSGGPTRTQMDRARERARLSQA